MQQIDRKVVRQIAFAYADVWGDRLQVFHDFVLVMKIEPLIFFCQILLRDHFKAFFALKIDRDPILRQLIQSGKFHNIVLLYIKFLREL